jgi:hypothetical protein
MLIAFGFPDGEVRSGSYSPTFGFPEGSAETRSLALAGKVPSDVFRTLSGADRLWLGQDPL